MAVPLIRAVGTVAAAAGTAIAPGLPAGTVSGDGLIMMIETGSGDAQTASGWTVEFAADAGGTTRLTVLSRIATGTDPTTTSTNANHALGRIIGIQAGTFDATDFPHVVGAGNTQATTVSVSITGINTTAAECLIVACSAGDLPDAAGTNQFSSPANASLANVTERIDNSTTAGNGGAILMITGDLATAGATGTTTATAANTAVRSNVTLSVCPPGAGAAGTIAVTEENDTSAISGTVANPITGTIGATEGADTSAIAAVETLSGTLGATEGDDTSAITGAVANPIIGTIAYTEEDDTPAFLGDSTSPAITGNISVSEADDTSNIAGTVVPPAVTGTISVTEGDDTSAFTGNSTVPGTLVTTEQDDTGAFLGIVANPATGTTTTTEEDDAGAFTGLISNPGTLTATEGDDSTNIVGVIANPITGTLDGFETADTGLFVGTTSGGVTVALRASSSVSSWAVASTVRSWLVESEVQ